MIEVPKTRSLQLGIADLLWWTVMASFICGAMTVPVYSSTVPWLSRAAVFVVLLVTAWRVRWQFHKVHG